MRRARVVAPLLLIASIMLVLVQPVRTQEPIPKIVEEKVRERFDRLRGDSGYPVDIKELHLSGDPPSRFDAAAVLPGCTFYRARVEFGIHYPRYTTVVVYKNQAYVMPYGFNQLLVDHKTRIDKNNLVEFARLFILLRQAGETPRIIFRSQTAIEEKCPLGLYQVRLETWSETHGVVMAWKFCAERGQFRAYHIEVLAVGEGGYADDPKIPRPLVGSGGMFPLPTISTLNGPFAGQVTVDKEYVVVARNDVPTNPSVTISLANFKPYSKAVIWAVSAATNPTYYFLEHTEVRTDKDGAADYIWTGLDSRHSDQVDVWVSGIDFFGQSGENVAKPRDPDDHYGSLVLEETRESEFSWNSQLYRLVIYYCSHYPFNGDPPSFNYITGDQFANLVLDNLWQSWLKQVGEWGFKDPLAQDSDKVLEIAMYDGDANHPSHSSSTTEFLPRNNKLIVMASNLYEKTRTHHYYTLTYPTVIEDIQRTIPHEFFHAIQWEYNRCKIDTSKSAWGWMIEGQATFIPTVQHPEAEIDCSWRTQYMECADDYLTEDLNKPLGGHTGVQYDYVLYWRFLHEWYKHGGTDTEKLDIVKRALTASNQTSGIHQSDFKTTMDFIEVPISAPQSQFMRISFNGGQGYAYNVRAVRTNWENGPLDGVPIPIVDNGQIGNTIIALDSSTLRVAILITRLDAQESAPPNYTITLTPVFLPYKAYLPLVMKGYSGSGSKASTGPTATPRPPFPQPTPTSPSYPPPGQVPLSPAGTPTPGAYP